MTYGLEIVPLDEPSVVALDHAHRQHAKFVQGLPANTPTPAPLASLGWLTMESFISMIKMNFLCKILCLNDENIYKKVILTRLLECFGTDKTHSKHNSPIQSMWDEIVKYKLDEIIRNCIRNSTYGKVSDWKSLIKKVIWRGEEIKWRTSCMLYKELRIYCSATKGITMHAWWALVNSVPTTFRYVSCVVSVMMGCQPRGLQCNFSRKTCALCQNSREDTSEHILFECAELAPYRDLQWIAVMDELPNAMADSIQKMNNKQKTEFFLSGLNSRYIAEWQSLYKEIAKFVYRLYQHRKAIYDDRYGQASNEATTSQSM